MLAALAGLGIEGREEVPGRAPGGARWEADVLFAVEGRAIAIELQRSYQNLRDYVRRQERYAASGVECYWLVRQEAFTTLAKATWQVRVKRDLGGRISQGCGLGTGMLPELPVAILTEATDAQRVNFGLSKSATVSAWLSGVVSKGYQFREGCWSLG